MFINESSSFKGIFPTNIDDVWKKMGLDSKQVTTLQNYINNHPELIGLGKTIPQGNLPRNVTYLKSGHVIIETEADKIETLEFEENETRGWDATTGELCVIKKAETAEKDPHLKEVGTYTFKNKQYIVKVLNDSPIDIDFLPVFPSEQRDVWKLMGITLNQLRQINNFIETHKQYIGKDKFVPKIDGELPRGLIFLTSGDVIIDTNADKIATLPGHEDKPRGWNATTGQLCVIQDAEADQIDDSLETIGTCEFKTVKVQSEKSIKTEIEKERTKQEENRPKTSEELNEMAAMRSAISAGNAEKVKSLLENGFKHKNISKDEGKISPLTYTLGYASLPEGYNGHGESPISLVSAKNIIQLLKKHGLDSSFGYGEYGNFFNEMQYKTQGIYGDSKEITDQIGPNYNKIMKVINNEAVKALIFAHNNNSDISVLPKDVLSVIASKLHTLVSNFL